MAVCTVCWNDKEITEHSYTLGGELMYNVKVCKGCHYNLRKAIQIVKTLGQSQLELNVPRGEGEPPAMPPEKTLADMEREEPDPVEPVGAIPPKKGRRTPDKV
jgi:hypothetical protein